MSGDTAYSKRSLAEKLGLKDGQTVCLLNAPPDYLARLNITTLDLELRPELVGPLDFIQFFTTSAHDLADHFPALKAALALKGQLWISWPKSAAKIARDVNENQIRDIGLANGLVDVKVISVDENWSGLKFVYRLKDR